MNTQTITLDLSKVGAYGTIVTVGQGDEHGTTIAATILSEGREVDLSGATAHLVARLPDKCHYYREAAAASGSVVTCTIDEERLCAVAGVTDQAYFEITKGGNTYSTARFTLEILRSAIDGQAPAESWDNKVSELIGTLGGAISDAGTATQAATTAASTASESARSANSAANSANEAAADALAAAEEARGAVSPDRALYLAYEDVGETSFLTLIDMEG